MKFFRAEVAHADTGMIEDSSINAMNTQLGTLTFQSCDRYVAEFWKGL